MEDATYEVKDGILVIGLGRELDHHSAGPVREMTEEILKERSLNGILFDFTNTTFMDSSGIGMIMGRYKRMRISGGFVGVAGVGPSIHRILEISGLYKIVEIYEIDRT